MRPIFVNHDLEKVISDQGYAVINNFAPDEVCDELRLFFSQTDTIDTRAFTITNWNNNTEQRTKTFDVMVSSLMSLASDHLQKFKPVMGVFTSKKPGENSEMLLHQDWSLVDETKYRSVSIWLALCHMDSMNGNLQVAKKSHIYSGYPRGMNVPVPFEEIRNYMHGCALTDIPLKKGDAVVFDHRLIHASPKNSSDQVRVAAVLAMVPEEADLIHYYKDLNNDDELEILKLDDKDFLLIDFFDMPNKPKHISVLGKIPFSFHALCIDEVEKFRI